MNYQPLSGTFRSYFGAICIPILDTGNGTISNVTHDWAASMGTMGAGLAVTVMRLQIRNRRDFKKGNYPNSPPPLQF